MFPAGDHVGEGSQKFENGRFYDSIGREGLEVAGEQPLVESSGQQCGMILANGREIEERLADTIESEAEACHRYDAESDQRRERIPPW